MNRILTITLVLLFRTFFFSFAFNVLQITLSRPRIIIGALICAFASSLFTADLFTKE